MDYELVRPFQTISETICRQYGLDPKLMLAIIYQESRGNTYAIRYEKNYRYTFEVIRHAKLNKISQESEEIFQKVSFGLCQVMGGTCRWLGFEGPLPELFMPPVNLKWASKYLARLLSHCATTEDAIASYNAGSVRKDDKGRYVNQGYVDSVMGHYKRIKGVSIG